MTAEWICVAVIITKKPKRYQYFDLKVTGQENISVEVIKGYFSQTKTPFLNVRQENALFNN